MKFIQRLERVEAFQLLPSEPLPPHVELHDWPENHDHRCGRHHTRDDGLDGMAVWYEEKDLCTCGMAANVKTFGVNEGVGWKPPGTWFIRIEIGQWLVIHEWGQIKVYDDVVFRREYELPQTLLPLQWNCPYCNYGEYKNREDWERRAADHIDGCLNKPPYDE